MKKILIALASIVIIVILLHLALFVFINLKGREVIIANLEKNFGQEVKLDSLTLSFPFAIELKNFSCADISFDKADASLGIFNPFRRLAIAKLAIKGLKINIVNDQRGLHVLPFFAKSKPQGVLEEKIAENQAALQPATNFIPKNGIAKDSEANKIIPMTIKDVQIFDSLIEYEDKTNPEAKPIIVKVIDVKLNNFSFPNPGKFYLKAKGQALVGETAGVTSIDLKGWVDYVHKNMDLDISLNNIGYGTFDPYWPPFWQSQNLGVKRAGLSFNSNLNSKENELTIKNSLALDSIEYIEVLEGQEENPRAMTLRTILAFLKGNGDKPVFNFVIKTKMDSPKLDFASVKDSFKETVPLGSLMVEGVAGQLKDSLEDKLKDNKNITVDEAIDAFKKSGEEIVDTLKNIFVPKKEEKESPPKETPQP